MTKIKSRRNRKSIKNRKSRRNRTINRKYKGGAANQGNDGQGPLSRRGTVVLSKNYKYVDPRLEEFAIIANQLIAKLYFNKDILTEEEKEKYFDLILKVADKLLYISIGVTKEYNFKTLKSNIDDYLANPQLGGKAAYIIHVLFDDIYQLE